MGTNHAEACVCHRLASDVEGINRRVVFCYIQFVASLYRAKGLTRAQTTVRHALRNAMVPIFPMILGEFVGIMSGSLIIEQIFGIPGVGALYVASIMAATPDYNFFMLLSAFYTLIGLLSGIIVDLSYGFIDPRIRIGSAK